MKSKRVYLAVCGGNTANEAEARLAEAAGAAIARRGSLLVCGGLGGVMEAACRGAKAAGGTVLGIVPGEFRSEANGFVDISVATNMGHARNAIIVHTADGMLAVGGESGTLSELALALKLRKPVVILKGWEHLREMNPAPHFENSPEAAVDWLMSQLMVSPG
ncbi:MAG: TIGR00725 family protein [bacterium]